MTKNPLPSADRLLVPILTALSRQPLDAGKLAATVGESFGFVGLELHRGRRGSGKTFCDITQSACRYLVSVNLLNANHLQIYSLTENCMRMLAEPNWHQTFIFGETLDEEPPKFKKHKRKRPTKNVARRNPRIKQPDLNSSVECLKRTIHTLGNAELMNYWLNANRVRDDTSKSKNHRDAFEIICMVEQQWKRHRNERGKGEYFPWPTTVAPEGDGNLQIEPVANGMLSYLGYRVGRTNGEATSLRHSILARVFEGSLPQILNPRHMERWGANGSAARLKKMAECLAAFARNRKRDDPVRYHDAIKEWEQDLFFLYEKYYVGKFNFAWPTTSVTSL